MATMNPRKRASARRFGLGIGIALTFAGAIFACRSVPRDPPRVATSASDAGVAPAPASTYAGEEATDRLVAYKDEAELRASMQAWKDREEARRRQQVYPMARRAR